MPVLRARVQWLHHGDSDLDVEQVSQYFCPLCGTPARTDAWWTQAQLDYMQGAAGPELDRIVEGAMKDALKGVKGLSFKSNQNFSFDIPTPEPLVEPDDMVIVEPPCHPNEPLKVPDDSTNHVHCLVCGSEFAT